MVADRVERLLNITKGQVQGFQLLDLQANEVLEQPHIFPTAVQGSKAFLAGVKGHTRHPFGNDCMEETESY
jgi:hypothetical protein